MKVVVGSDENEKNNRNENTNNRNDNDNDSGALIVRAPMHITSHASSKTTGTLAKFQERSYQGLDPRYGQDQVQQEIVDGLSGIAKSYGTTNKEETKERK